MTPAEQLRAAKALIDTPERWTKGEAAVDAEGMPVACMADAAVSWCALGALRKHFDRCPEAECFLAQAAHDCVPSFNDDDETTHADIMKLFDDAIALAEAAQ